MARKLKRLDLHGHYKKIGKGRYRGDTRIATLPQIRAMHYFADHDEPRKKGKKKRRRI